MRAKEGSEVTTSLCISLIAQRDTATVKSPPALPCLQRQQLRVLVHIKSRFSTSQIRTITLKIGAIRESLAAVQLILPPSAKLVCLQTREIGFMGSDHQVAFIKTKNSVYLCIYTTEKDKIVRVPILDLLFNTIALKRRGKEEKVQMESARRLEAELVYLHPSFICRPFGAFRPLLDGCVCSVQSRQFG